MPPALPTEANNLEGMRAAMRHALDPVAFSTDVLQFWPDPWQVSVLQSSAPQLLICCSRQSGKSTIAGIAALHMANFHPGSLTIMLSPTQRQSTELLAKASTFLRRLPNAKLDNESSIAIRFADGSRLVSLPGTDPDRIRGFSSPALIIVDEGAFVDDKLYYAIRPMLAVGGGRIIAMSTPNGKRGWFHDAWNFDGPDDWQRERVTAYEVPRITAEFLAKERKRIGDRWFRQEYLCEFVSSDEELFSGEDIQAAIMPEISAFQHTIGI